MKFISVKMHKENRAYMEAEQQSRENSKSQAACLTLKLLLHLIIWMLDKTLQLC